MITKAELVELIRRRLVGQISNESEGSFDEPLIAKYLGRAFNMVLWEVFRGGVHNLDNYNKRYTGVAVAYNSTKDRYFSTLPADIVQLPRVGSGVLKIQTQTGTTAKFIPISSQEVEFIDGQEVDLISNNIRYVIRGKEVEYFGMTSAIASVGVDMDLVIPIDEYDWDDDVMIPSGQDQRLIEITVAFATGQPVDDQINNNQQDNRIATVPK